MLMKKNVFLVFMFAAFISQAQAQQIPKEPAGKFIQVAGHRLWVHVFGKGEPLLFIPGGPGAAHHFWPDMNRFADSYTVIYYDPFGRGQSERAKDPSAYSLANDVEEVEALRIALGIKKWNVYGKSYGSVVAQAYALKYQSSLSHLILAEAFHSTEMWQKGNDDYGNAQIQKQYPQVWRELDSLRKKGYVSTDSVYQAVLGRVNDGLLYYFNPNNNATENFDMNLEVYKQIAGKDADVVLGGDLAKFDFRGRLKEIKVPTLIIAGRFDRVSTPEYVEQYQLFMPQAKLVMFEKSGHHPSIEEPDLHARVLLDFLKDQ